MTHVLILPSLNISWQFENFKYLFHSNQKTYYSGSGLKATGTWSQKINYNRKILASLEEYSMSVATESMQLKSDNAVRDNVLPPDSAPSDIVVFPPGDLYSDEPPLESSLHLQQLMESLYGIEKG